MEPIEAERSMPNFLTSPWNWRETRSPATGQLGVLACFHRPTVETGRFSKGLGTHGSDPCSFLRRRRRTPGLRATSLGLLGPLAGPPRIGRSGGSWQPGAEELSKALIKETREFDGRGFSLVRRLGAMKLRLPQDQETVQAVRLLATVAEETRGGIPIANSGLLLSHR